MTIQVKRWAENFLSLPSIKRQVGDLSKIFNSLSNIDDISQSLNFQGEKSQEKKRNFNQKSSKTKIKTIGSDDIHPNKGNLLDPIKLNFWLEKLEKSHTYKETYVLDIIIEMIEQENNSAYDHTLISQFLMKCTSLGGIFGKIYIASYIKRLTNDSLKIKVRSEIFKEFVFNCQPILYFNREIIFGLKEDVKKFHCEEELERISSDLRKDYPIEEAILCLNNPHLKKSQDILISCLYLPDPFLHYMAPRLIHAFGSNPPFNMSVLVKRLILWGNNMMEILNDQHHLDHFLSDEHSPHLTFSSSSNFIYPENQWFLLQCLILESKNDTQIYKSIQMLTSFRNFASSYSLSKKKNPELSYRLLFILQDMKSKLKKDSDDYLLSLISVYEFINEKTITIHEKISQNSIQFSELDSLLIHIANDCKVLYKDNIDGFKTDIKEFTNLVTEAKKEFNHESIQEFWNKEKNSSLNSMDDKRNFIEQLENIIEDIFFLDDSVNNSMDMIRYLREMITEKEKLF